jgi:hypothetical protein
MMKGVSVTLEVSARQVMEVEGRIEKVFRGKGGLGGAIRLIGIYYRVMDAEPVSEGTKVRFTFLSLRPGASCTLSGSTTSSPSTAGRTFPNSHANCGHVFRADRSRPRG